MAIGLVGYKVGMTRYFNEIGMSIPVTVIKFYDNCITGIREYGVGNYSVKISAKLVDKDKLNRSLIGFYNNIGVSYRKYINEFSICKNNVDDYVIGNELRVSLFTVDDIVDVIGISKGKGFSGVIRRYNFSAQRFSHGNSRSHRVPGSIGQCQTPGKVFKGKKMPGHMGNIRVTIKNLKIVCVYNNESVILVKGGIPGPNGRKIIVKKMVVG